MKREYIGNRIVTTLDDAEKTILQAILDKPVPSLKDVITVFKLVIDALME